jgi:hypothetical protein
MIKKINRVYSKQKTLKLSVVLIFFAAAAHISSQHTNKLFAE